MTNIVDDEDFFIGVDVGTNSVRCGIFNKKGIMISSSTQPLVTYRRDGDFVEQSSHQIWGALCSSVRLSMDKAKISSLNVRGIGFDATCSLVVVGKGGIPLSVSSEKDEERNVIVWMDHRQQKKQNSSTPKLTLSYLLLGDG